MYHSVTFGAWNALTNRFEGKNTWDDWQLIPSSRPLFKPPAPKTNFIDIPGVDGSIDLTEAITGYPVFSDREGSLEFIVYNQDIPWHEIYSEISEYLHGQTMDVMLEDDPGWYYRGRFSVAEWRSEKDWSRIVIDYHVGPYKWSVLTSLDDWLWDPFSFVNGVIRKSIFHDAEALNNAPIRFTVMDAGYAPVMPVLTPKSSGTLIINDSQSFPLTANSSLQIFGLVLYKGGWIYKGRPATVKAIFDPPLFRITEQPVDITGAASSNVHFHVGVSSDSTVTYKWQYQTASADPSGSWTNLNSFAGNDSHTLTVPVTAARSGNKYRCKVTKDDVTLTSDYATLTTATPTFEIIYQPKDQTGVIGTDAIFHVGVTGSSPTFRWEYFDGDDWTVVATTVEGYNTDTLVVPIDASLHGRQYRCKITKSGNTLISDTAVLSVQHIKIDFDFRPGRL